MSTYRFWRPSSWAASRVWYDVRWPYPIFWGPRNNWWYPPGWVFSLDPPASQEITGISIWPWWDYGALQEPFSCEQGSFPTIQLPVSLPSWWVPSIKPYKRGCSCLLPWISCSIKLIISTPTPKLPFPRTKVTNSQDFHQTFLISQK